MTSMVLAGSVALLTGELVPILVEVRASKVVCACGTATLVAVVLGLLP